MNPSKQTLLAKIDRTIGLVEATQKSCGHAQMAETIDLFSKNKWVSAYSGLSNHAMQTDLRQMRAALNELKYDIKHWQNTSHLHAPNDHWDCIADFFLDWDTDWFSLYNLGQITRIKTQCGRILHSLQQLRATL